MGNLFIFFLIVTKSLQSTNIREEKYCECYDRCQKNFTVNNAIHEQSKAACERGCRFYSLVFHSSQDADPSIEKAKAKERCQTSCTQSYMNSTDVTACNFGCSSMKLTDKDVCTFVQHTPQDVIEFVFDESTAVIHLEEPELDDVLIDIALKKQLESSFGNNRSPIQKLPEITFTNLPISRQDRIEEYEGVTIIKCPRFYEFYVKFALRHRSITPSELYFVGGVLIVAIIFFAVNRHLEKHRKLWKEIFIGIIQDGQERMMENNLVLVDCLPVKEDIDDYEKDALEETKNPIGSEYDGITLVYYENDDSRYHTKLSQNNF